MSPSNAPFVPVTGERIVATTRHPASSAPVCAAAVARASDPSSVGAVASRKLEHRLDEPYEISVSGDTDPFELGDRFAEREVRDVDGHEVDSVGHERLVEVADVRRLEIDHTSVLPQRTEQLAVTGVNCVDASRAAREELRREPAGGRANVEARLGRTDRRRTR